jgi:hypothetical protein
VSTCLSDGAGLASLVVNQQLPAAVIENACLTIATLCYLSHDNCIKFAEADGCFALAALLNSEEV